MTAIAVRGKRERVIAPLVTGQEVVLLVVVAALWLVLWWATPAFLSADSLRPLLIEVAPVALIGVGMTLVIVSAGIDVSVGSGMMVCGVITARLLVEAQVPLVVALLVAIAVGALLGAVNGVLIAWGRVHAIIITFGTLNLFQFVGRQIFGSQTVNGIPSTLDLFGRGDAGRTFGLPHSFLLMAVIAAAVWWYLRQTPGGRHFYAIGGDPVAAELAGVRVRRRVLLAYVVTGALVGLAAVFTIAKGTATLDQSIGSGKELAVIAAVVIGGTSIMGGRGSVLGTVLGALLVQTVASGVTQLGWPSDLSDLFVGVFVIIAVGADLLRERARRAKR
ncbi:ABC transporter permease [Amycolatopsis sp. CA-230715]|uniref:ABC transporter permease n=1 Tax=Amycolatopsis sp. CA-230715 TaxID=2745196 RepID=UPI001C010306|nr:ABC transporter permease [Amycolatopsis sp. CA-230715]QWF83631.1 Ribose import permease protein RbsC [Amycolatopsis sp. CA-230715]